MISIIGIYSFLTNFVWEMLQMPFYKNMNWDLQSTLYCFAASIGDVFMILIIFFIVAYFVKDLGWIKNLNFKKMFVTLFTGLLLSLFVEEIALGSNMWNYTDLMPKIPYTNFGIAPVLQMLVLPILIFKLSDITIKNLSNKKNSS